MGWANAHIHRAAANDTDVAKPRGLRFRCNVLLSDNFKVHENGCVRSYRKNEEKSKGDASERESYGAIAHLEPVPQKGPRRQTEQAKRKTTQWSKGMGIVGTKHVAP